MCIIRMWYPSVFLLSYILTSGLRNVTEKQPSNQVPCCVYAAVYLSRINDNMGEIPDVLFLLKIEWNNQIVILWL